jgi:hypothetical protein
VPHVRQRLEVALLGFVSTRCIASEVLIKASFIKKKGLSSALDRGNNAYTALHGTERQYKYGIHI